MMETSRRTLLKGIAVGAAGAVSGLAMPKAQAATHANNLVEPATEQQPLKLNYGGLFTCSESNRTKWSPDLGQYWLKVNWSQLEPTPGVYSFGVIDNYLAAHPGVYVRLHIGGGDNAPAWLASFSGPFVSVKNSRDNVTSLCGRYWMQGYKDRFALICAALGAKYDNNPYIASINNFSNSLVYDEPWILGGDAGSVTSLYNAGLTQSTSQSAQLSGLATLAAAFPTTIMEMPGHGDWDYPVMKSGVVKTKYDWPAGRTMFNDLHDLYQDHIIFTDYGLGPDEYTSPQPRATATSYYAWMHQLADEGFPVAFQLTLTGSGQKPTQAQMSGGIDAGISMGASWIEHSDWSLLDNSAVQTFDSRIKANIA
jgi:hypothetical protein